MTTAKSDNDFHDRVLIFGSTGQQGGGVLFHLARLVQSGEPYIIRVCVRNKERFLSKWSNIFKQNNFDITKIEIFIGDFNDINSLTTALKDVNIIFLTTNWNFETETNENEIERGNNVITALKQSQILKKDALKQLIYSSLPETPAYIESVSKTGVCRQLKQLQTEYNNSFKLNFVYFSFYFENFTTFMPITKHLFSRKLHYWAIPFTSQYYHSKIGHISHMDAGGVIAGLIKYEMNNYNGSKDSNEYNEVYCVSELLSVPQMLCILSKVLNLNYMITYEPLSMRQVSWLPYPAPAIEVMQFFGTHGSTFKLMEGANDKNELLRENIEKSKYLFDLAYEMYNNDSNKNSKEKIGLTSIEEWANENKEMIESGGGMGDTLSWVKRYVEVMEVFSRPSFLVPVVSGLIVGAGVIGKYFYDKKYKN